MSVYEIEVSSHLGDVRGRVYCLSFMARCIIRLHVMAFWALFPIRRLRPAFLSLFFFLRLSLQQWVDVSLSIQSLCMCSLTDGVHLMKNFVCLARYPSMKEQWCYGLRV